MGEELTIHDKAKVTLHDGVIVSAKSVTVKPGGAAKGTGTFVTPLFTNKGLIAPGKSPGVLIIDGDYVQDVGAVLEVEIGGSGPES